MELLPGLTGTSRAQEWEYLGLPDQYIIDIVLQSQDTIYAATPRLFGQTPGIIFKTTNSGATWDTVLYYAGTLDLKMHPRNREILYAAMGSIDPPYGILKTTNGGESWFHADSGMVVDWERLVQVVEFDPVHPETLYAGTAGPFGGNIYKSTNGGGSWSALGSIEGVASIAVDQEFTETVYSGTVGGGFLEKSTDGGNTWNLTGLQGFGVVSLSIDPQDHLLIYAGVDTDGGGLQKSADGGITWEVANSGFPPQSQAGDMIIEPMTRVVYATVAGYPDTGGVYRSTDLGDSWVALEGLPSGNRFKGIAFSPDLQELYVSVIDYGVYRTSIVSHAHESSPFRARALTLYPNYPNPFNGSTVILYELTETDEIEISVYDLIGKEVAELVKGSRPPGRHSVFFDGVGLSTGTYFCHMSTVSAGNFITRMLIIR